MCWIKVSSAAGRSRAGFDVYYFEIRHRRKQSPRGLRCRARNCPSVRARATKEDACAF